MKIFICTDLEGIGGITCFDQTRDKTNLLYQEARHLLTQEVNACVQGCLDGDHRARRHGGGFNFFVEDSIRPLATSPVLADPGPTTAWIYHRRPDFLGYHAMNGTEDGVLHHTQSSLGENKYWYNGESGELVQTSSSPAITTSLPSCVVAICALRGSPALPGRRDRYCRRQEGFSRTSSIIRPAKSRELSARRTKAMAVIPSCRPTSCLCRSPVACGSRQRKPSTASERGCRENR